MLSKSCLLTIPIWDLAGLIRRYLMLFGKLGCCETEFKTHFYNHRQSFNHRDKANATELFKTVWKYKDKGIKPRITWSIVCKSFAYTSGAKRCKLCLAEKLAILQADQRTLFNKRSEFISQCRHRNKFKLKKV